MSRIAIILLLLSLASFAQSASDPYVPPELKPWQEWVLEGEEFRECPIILNRKPDADAFICSWSEPLQLVVNARGGRFDFRVQTYIESWVALPGDSSNFPSDVSIDNKAVAVIEQRGQPSLFLPAGIHRVSGKFNWTRRPETLGIPASIALQQLNVDGRVISNPERQGNRVWLGEPRQKTAQAESPDIQVYRKLSDGIPMRLETQLRLAVAGGAREVLLARALPTGFLPLAINSSLPSKFEADGRLRVQLRPGNWQINIYARAIAVGDELVLTDPGEPWADSEIWSYESDSRLRVTNVTGEVPVDPGQVNVPGGWQQLPAFNLAPGQKLTIEERGRGMSEQENNRLFLQRTLWLDFDGGGLSARDQISGQMRRDWRLDMQQPFVLNSANHNGESLLITQGAQPDFSGVEVRSPSANLEASSRLTLQGALPVTGWTQQLAEMQARLNLPPGFMLMATTGVDQSPDTWAARWKLLDYFLVLVIAVAVRRLFGNLAGAVALLSLVVTFHEPGAPVWSWLNLVIALALAGAVSEGRFGRLARSYRNASFLFLIILLVPFIANQVRLALFPQLETVPLIAMSDYGTLDQKDVWGGAEVDYERSSEVAHEAPARLEAQLKRRAMPSSVSSLGTSATDSEEIVVTGSRIKRVSDMRYDPNALVQTGPGLPGWRWRSVGLGWSGPVEANQTFRLFLLSPWQTALWRLLGAALAAYLLYLLLGRAFNLSGSDPKPSTGSSPAQEGVPGGAAGSTAAGASLSRSANIALALLLGLCILAPISSQALAETPPTQILDELKRRLTTPADCMPQCALATSAQVDASQAELAIEMDVHALESVAIPLPGNEGVWQADSFNVDGRPRSLLYRDPRGVLWLPLDAGIHRVRISAAMPVTDSFQVSFPLQPKEIQVSAVGWELGGVQDARMVTGSLELIRIKPAETGSKAVAETLTADRFASFVQVTRVLELGLDWRVRTTVQRIAPERGAISLEIPLLPGESVTTEKVLVRDGKASVALAAGERLFGWSSTLTRTPSIRLQAPADQPWVEIWQLEAGHSWHASYEGTPLIMPQQFADEFWVPEFHPRPGESLDIDVSRPESVPGNTLAMDRVSYVQQVGERNSTLSLELAYRSTRGQQHTITFPDGAELESVVIDGREQSLRLDNGKLNLPVVPGEHSVQIRFRLADGAHWVQRQPLIDLAAPVSNVTQGFDLQRDRWVLATRGPALGPAVLYWAELVVFIFLAWLLGRTAITPLKTRDWLLLGLGFSTFSWGVLALVTAWLFAMGWRARSPDLNDPTWFNLRQLVLIVASITVLLTLLSAIPMALLGNPDMHVVGNNSHMFQLRWFSDRVSEAGLPTVSVFSTPLWTYKLLILLWALWLSFALVKWLPWAWQSLRTGGFWLPRTSASKPKEPMET